MTWANVECTIWAYPVSLPRAFGRQLTSRWLFYFLLFYTVLTRTNKPSPMCSFCEKSEDSLEHLFIYCDTSKDFWFSVIEWLKEHSFGVNHLSALDITFGLIRKENLLLNHIIILGKHVIYQSRSLNIKPTLMLLKAKIRSTYQIESFIAEKNKDLEIHKKKWQKLLPFMDNL